MIVMSETLRVLVHTDKDPSDDFAPQNRVWNLWKEFPDTHAILSTESPTTIDYLDALTDPPRRIVVGGQLSYACVRVQLNELALHPRIKNGEIELRLSRSATFGDYLEDVVEDVHTRTGVKIQIVE